VLLHTLFATGTNSGGFPRMMITDGRAWHVLGVTVVSLRTKLDLGVSNVMLTVLGVSSHFHLRA
jgi:hypothetical protein